MAGRKAKTKDDQPPKHPINLHPVHQYAQDVVDGRVVACKKVIQACQRHLNDLQREDLFFDEAAANRVFLFAENLKHVKGTWDSPYLRLELWQKFVFGSVFGWKRAETGLRRFRTVYCQIPRKNGKSTVGAVIGNYMMVADGEPGAEVVSAATTRDQARIIFDYAKAMVRSQPALKKRLGVLTRNIHDIQTSSKFEPVSADAHTLDGLNIHCALVDELHAHKDSTVWDVLATATGSRRQPLMVAITTAGFERSVCIQKYNYCEQILGGVIDDDTVFAYITEIDPGDDWTDPAVWAKANPNLGVSLFPEQLEALCLEARHMPSQQNNFRCKHLNEWVNQAERWLNLEDWKACVADYSEESLYGRACYGGLDLSVTIDLTACVLVFPPEERDEPWKAIYRFWVPRERVQKRARGYTVDKVPFDVWERDGLILTTPGNVVDYEYIRNCITGFQDADDNYHQGLSDLFDIKEIAYDPHNATETAIKLQDAGLNMIEYRQGGPSFNAPMRRFEGMLLDRQFAHTNHPAMTWMANNMVVRYDANLNMAPDKKNAKDRIDGMVSLLMGIGRAIHSENDYLTGYEGGIHFI